MHDYPELIWIGPRRSDIEDIKNVFGGAIVIMGEEILDKNFTCYSFEYFHGKRINHNDPKYFAAINEFVFERMEHFINKSESSRFLFYGQPPIGISNHLISYCIAYNPHSLISLISDKMRMRTLMSSFVSTLPFVAKFGFECSYSYLQKLFPGESEFVIQKPLGASGGFGTQIIKSETEDKKLTIPVDEILISPYKKNSVSINQHLVITRSNVTVLPASIQIVEEMDHKLLYLGADFIAAKQILGDHHTSILTRKSQEIGEVLQRLGYMGTLGIDYLIDSSDNLFFVEINPRFQASTFILNKTLIDNELPSIQELHVMAFKEQSVSVPPLTILQSFITKIHLGDENSFPSNGLYEARTIEGNPFDLNNEDVCLKYQVINALRIDQVDNLTPVYSLVLKDSIIGKGGEIGLHLRPNIHYKFIEKQTHLKLKTDSNLALLKIQLLVLGARISEEAVTHIENEMESSFRYSIGYGVDIRLPPNIYVNVPIRTKFAVFSPFEIDWNSDNGFFLSHRGEFLVKILPSLTHRLAAESTANGVVFNSMGQLINDRLRISPFPLCKFNSKNKLACKFCDIGYAPLKSKYKFEDIAEMIRRYHEELPEVRHYLIGGGTAGENGWKLILKITEYIRSLTEKSIYLMVTPPEDFKILDKLKVAGVSEIGFNIEFFNRALAKKYMPGKAQISLEKYTAAFDHATSLWGSEGNVRSILIVGIEPYSESLKAVDYLCSRGVMPILSAFRPTPFTEMEYFPEPLPHDLFKLWKEAQSICDSYGMTLGPKCLGCQNNTVTFPVNEQYVYY